MENFNILAENQEVKNALGLFFDNYKEAVVQFLNNVLRNELGASDAFIEKDEDGVYKVYHTAPDKGYVLAPVAAAADGKTLLIEAVAYTGLVNDAKYVVFDGQKLALFLKKEGKPDVKVGHFQNINDVVTQINSESVNNAIETFKKAEENAGKEEAKVERKTKLKKLAKGND